MGVGVYRVLTGGLAPHPGPLPRGERGAWGGRSVPAAREPPLAGGRGFHCRKAREIELQNLIKLNIPNSLLQRPVSFPDFLYSGLLERRTP